MKREQILLENMSDVQVKHTKAIIDREANRRHLFGKSRKAGQSGQHKVSTKK